MEIIIRPAAEAEAGILTEIAFASKRHWQYPEAWITLWAGELTVTEAYIRSNAVFSALAAGVVSGWYALNRSEAVWELDYLWVRPEWIGAGVGRAMLRHALALFLDSRAEAITVISDPFAEGFYLKMGFEKVGVHPSTPAGRFLPVLRFSRR